MTANIPSLTASVVRATMSKHGLTASDSLSLIPRVGAALKWAGAYAEVVAELVTTAIERSDVAAADVPKLIQDFGAQLAFLADSDMPPRLPQATAAMSTAPVAPGAPQKPAVDPKNSYTDENITCIECGEQLKMLTRHLRAYHGLSFADYRAKWGLPPDYPTTSPKYQAAKREEARAVGLGTRANKAGGNLARTARQASRPDPAVFERVVPGKS